MIVAIDGPSGAGKSTVSREVAKESGFSCLDTGAMYRAVAWIAMEEGVPFDDEEALGALARTRPITFVHETGDPYPKEVHIDGHDVTEQIRTARIDRAVSPVSAVPAVREALLEQQRRIGASGDFVVEGRDIGTVVFPDAKVKVFLTASDEARAQRRVAQNAERGVGSVDFDEVLADIVRRDELDSTRAAAPLAAAPDAIVIDSSAMTFEAVVERIRSLIEEARS